MQEMKAVHAKELVIGNRHIQTLSERFWNFVTKEQE